MFVPFSFKIYFRKPFINREITNYRARHQKCNFRIFYNKHMLDMDDLATLDGQNWLNDQVGVSQVLSVSKVQRTLVSCHRNLTLYLSLGI